MKTKLLALRMVKKLFLKRNKNNKGIFHGLNRWEIQ